MRLEEFAERGRQAQAAVDQAAAKADTTIRLSKILAEQLGVSEADVVPDVLLVSDGSGRPNLGCDSLDIIELSMAAEEEFEIALLDDDVSGLNGATFSGLVDFIHAKREALP